ncbi:Glycerophosphoryl diester phosphodiesterase family-domain-containing protein [Calycina marina]|uniref:Glycerophosphoryl diester phosphodiesterase family-domain-containing protein n=1 Tax=Calycina marina TaxID=1763456 RepID=A0A9P7Z4E4_9HELO|nr:Glycerophosphoryl diester phosphodiesterase family-domain-containing protein [Calycina marina]
MKFGRNLSRNQVPEWSTSYINYKGLKKLIKAAAALAKANEYVDTAEFFFSLDRNLEDVNSFYNKKFGDASRRLKLLQDRYGTSKESLDLFDRHDVEELMGALLELRSQLRKIQWFGEVNRKGFIKITKKIDKKIPKTCTQEQYMTAKVDQCPFATNKVLKVALDLVNTWLGDLGDIKAKDEAEPAHSVHKMKRVSSRSILNLPAGLLDTVDGAIRDDDVPTLKETLLEANVEPVDLAMQRLLLNLLQRSISCKSKGCITYLLGEIKFLDETDDINHRNCLHRLVISIGRAKTANPSIQQVTAVTSSDNSQMQFITPARSPSPGPPQSKLTEATLLGFDDDHVQILSLVLSKLQPEQRVGLVTKDNFGRLPLHYAAQFGFVVICQLVMKHMQDWGQFNVEHGIDAPEWQDIEGMAPLHLSVIGGHALTTKALLKGENWKGQNDQKIAMRREISKSSAVLAIATKANFTVIVKLLVNAGVDINWQDATGETALHLAARFGHNECAEILLVGSPEQKADCELTENSFDWTPLHVACVDGHLAIVELLISAGAELNKPDASGWLPREHAALRGHIDIAEILAAAAPDIPKTRSPSPPISATPSSVKTSSSSSSPPGVSSMEALRSRIINGNGNTHISEPVQPVKTFGHRYLTNESMVLVSLGSMDMRKDTPAVVLDQIPIAKAHSTQLDTALSIVVTATDGRLSQGKPILLGEPTTIDLPVQETISTDPIVFTALDASKVRLYFDIVPTYSGNEDRKIGRGIAILSTIKQSIGTKRMNLQGDVSVPIMGNDLEIMGSINFNFLIITPFSHPNMGITTKHTYWKEVSSTMVIGHRGLGKNSSSKKSLQLGENTLQSFIAAANLGANYVEFDVQLTKDLVPVIYHDFLVSETGIDAPVHTLTLEQFLHVNNPQSSQDGSPKRSTQHHMENPNVRVIRGEDRQRSLSMGHGIGPDFGMADRMRHTKDFKEKGYKGNSRGISIQAPFTTLEEMLIKLPEDVGFNVEMKYPMLHESEEQEMDSYAVELNSFVDTVLNKVYDLSKKRKIIFSSFNPDICLLLSFKQPSIPILFLSDAGTSPVGDIRASSLQEAIRFASRWNLLGVVSAAVPLCNSPRLVKVVKDSGLVCVSYGSLNNDSDKVQQQVDQGIDAVIVDSVLKIRNGLTKSSKIRAAWVEPPAETGAGEAIPVLTGSALNTPSAITPIFTPVEL